MAFEPRRQKSRKKKENRLRIEPNAIGASFTRTDRNGGGLATGRGVRPRGDMELYVKWFHLNFAVCIRKLIPLLAPLAALAVDGIFRSTFCARVRVAALPMRPC